EHGEGVRRSAGGTATRRPSTRRQASGPTALRSKRDSTCISTSNRSTVIPADKRSGPTVLAVSAPRVAGESLMLTRSSQQILRERTDEKFTSIRDVTLCG